MSHIKDIENFQRKCTIDYEQRYVHNICCTIRYSTGVPIRSSSSDNGLYKLSIWRRVYSSYECDISMGIVYISMQMLHPKVDELGESQHSTELWYITLSRLSQIVLGRRCICSTVMNTAIKH